MNILGIDPGLSGGAVLLDSGGNPRAVAKYTCERDFVEFIRIARDAGDVWVYIEKVNAFPGQGIASTWKFAANYGFEKGVIQSHDLPMEEVTPGVWQRGFGLPKAKTKTKHKTNLYQKACELFPTHKWTRATCDAALIAYYGSRHRISPAPRLIP